MNVKRVKKSEIEVGQGSFLPKITVFSSTDHYYRCCTDWSADDVKIGSTDCCRRYLGEETTVHTWNYRLICVFNKKL